MKKIIIITTFLIGTFNAIAQITNVEVKFDLPITINESSGAIFFNNRLITHNDSGNENKLYELDTISGLVTRTVTIVNATNVDWEDMTHDQSYIYIGDIGNNNGTRTDLKIYKINKSDYLNSDDVSAEIINFSYSDQTDFSSNPNSTEWDAEALLSFDTNYLLLFTKNWINGTTKVYPIPKSSGTYAVNSLTTTLPNAGLITGATYNPITNKVYIIGYTLILQAFVWICENFTDYDVFSGTNTQISLTSLGMEQAEGITYVNANRYFITSESFSISSFSDSGKLMSFTTNDNVLTIEDITTRIVNFYPNPVKDVFFIDGFEHDLIEIYDTKYALVYRGYGRQVDMSAFHNGLYLVKINFVDGTSTVKKIIKESFN